MRLYIRGEFIEMYRRTVAELSQHVLRTNDETEKGRLETIITNVVKLISALKNQNFKRTIIRASTELFRDKRFNSMRNNNPNIFAVDNGVIETLNDGAIFRPGRPEDYLTKGSNVRYNPNLSEKSESVQEVRTWFNKCFIDQSLVDMVFKLYASSLRARNSDKIFPVHSGELGNNSKTMMKKLVEQTFGTYSVTCPDSILTEKQKGSGPSPEYARLAGANIAWIFETDEDDPIRNSNLKKATGGDRFFARYLNEDGGERENTATLHLMCNKIPMIPKSEKAIFNRLIVIPYLSVWEDNAPESIEEQYEKRIFKADHHFENKISQLVQAFLWLLVQYYKRYTKEGLVIPAVITEYTNKYWEENDTYTLFRNDRIEVVLIKGSVTDDKPEGDKDTTVGIEISKVFRHFISWYKENMSGETLPKRPTVVAELTRRWGKPQDGKWWGIRHKDYVAANVE